MLAGLVAGCGGGDHGRDPILGLPSAALVGVSVTPATASVNIGAGQQFAATATYADGASRDVSTSAVWTSGTPAVASVSASGLATGLAAGSSSIGASFGGMAGSATLTVNPPVLTSVSIAPLTPALNIGATQQFTVRGNFSDGSSHDVSATATFSSATPAVATVTTGGLATAVAAGSSLITASAGGFSASTTLTVLPPVLVSIALTPVNPTLAIAATQPLTVTATYSDGSTANVTASSVFTSAAPAVAFVGLTSGIASGISAGSSVITASFGGMTATTTVTVAPATVTLVSIAVTPAAPSIAAGATQAFIATATYSDASTANITATANWTSGNTAVATILPTGVATGVAAGSALITATSGGQAGTATLTVTPIVAVAAPNLASATGFGVLAGGTLINNAGGTTMVTGDIGTSGQPIPVNQAVGFNDILSGAPLTTALSDLGSAVADVRSRTCTSTVFVDTDLGGMTLSPGVYCYIGALSITGTLTLNGPGVYIFNSTGNLSTAPNASVVLTGGASPEQVFWSPIGTATLGAGTAFQGTIMSLNDIKLNDGASLTNGRVLTTGNVGLTNNVIAK